jgi:hypothetical protein
MHLPTRGYGEHRFLDLRNFAGDLVNIEQTEVTPLIRIQDEGAWNESGAGL